MEEKQAEPTTAVQVSSKTVAEPTQMDIATLLSTVGQLETTKAQQEILFAKVDAEDVLIRPDGIVYLDWTFYAERLTTAFPAAWTIVPQGLPQVNGNLVVWGFYLLIRGHLMGFAIGEQSRANANMSWGECCEGAKSNALMRLCKGMGMGLELWHKPFIEDWKKNNAEEVQAPNGNKKVWKRKSPARVSPEREPVIEAEVSTYNPGTQTKIAIVVPAKRMIKNWNDKDVDADAKIGTGIAGLPKFQDLFVSKFKHPEHFKNHLEKHFGVTSAAELTWDQCVALYNHLHNGEKDPRFYPEEPAGEAAISGWDGIKAVEKLYVDKGLEPLYKELVAHLETILGSISGHRVKSAMTIIVEAIGTVYDNPPTEADIVEFKDTLDKEFRKGDKS